MRQYVRKSSILLTSVHRKEEEIELGKSSFEQLLLLNVSGYLLSEDVMSLIEQLLSNKWWLIEAVP